MAFNPLSPGTVLSRRYKIVNLIRQGGMGATYRGEDLEADQTVAVKQLVDSFESPEDRESGIGNFLAEMRVLKDLHHPQIPRILDHFIHQKAFFFILEYIEGKDFTRQLESAGRSGFDENRVVKIGIEACRVLEYLHGKKPPVIHRDIKSSNLIERAGDGRIFVVDFGISKAAKPKAGMMIGTPGYSPPEQHLNQTDPRSDIYALGATLHELSTGKRPDPDNFQFISPHEIKTEISLPFSEIVMAAAAYMPEDRFQSPLELEEALGRLLPSPLPRQMEDPFQRSCAAYGSEILFPLLLEIKKHHVNECDTALPSRFSELFTFTLTSQIAFSLIIQPRPETQSVRFYLREGLLAKAPVGEIIPGSEDAERQTGEILERFLSAYQGM